MAEKIVIKLNQDQKERISKYLGKICDSIEVNKEELPGILKYIPPRIVLDLDDQQVKMLKGVYPGVECDFIDIDATKLGTIMRYMGPPITGRKNS